MYYTFAQKQEFTREYARAANVDSYRLMLASHSSRLSNLILADRQTLARTLYYELLGYCSPEEIEEFCSRTAAAAKGKILEQPLPASHVKKANKFEEYPAIRWRELDNSQVRTADAIFSDRVNCFARLSEIEKILDDEASSEVVAEYVETSIRMELCFDELRSFNSTGEFAGKHPFIARKTERERVMEVLGTDPERYFEERKNIELNISRYSSYLRRKSLEPADKEKYKSFLDRYHADLALYKECFKAYVAQKNI